MKNLDKYLKEDFTSIAGWCNPNTFDILKYMWVLQDRIGAKGPVAEFGVYEGKFFAGLNNLPTGGGRNLAVDVFGQPELIADKTKAPEKKKFEDNVNRTNYANSDFDVLVSDSLMLSPAELRREYGQFRAISVDGGHLLENVVHDFSIAEELVSSAGMAIFDDVFNPRWPEVTEAISRAYILGTPKIVPLYYAFNKMIAVPFTHHDYFYTELV
ncbi:MAG TPA: hypothetical protein EYH38_02330 [Leucothrix sp.]|nr:hypothetical protein [Leucothrix sp.]